MRPALVPLTSEDQARIRSVLRAQAAHLRSLAEGDGAHTAWVRREWRQEAAECTELAGRLQDCGITGFSARRAG